VRESLLKTPENLREIWVEVSRKGARAEEIARLGADKGVPVQFKEVREIAAVTSGAAHQGFVAFPEAFSYTDLEDLIEKSRQASDSALVVVADHITDEGNLGALIRTAGFFSGARSDPAQRSLGQDHRQASQKNLREPMRPYLLPRWSIWEEPWIS